MTPDELISQLISGDAERHRANPPAYQPGMVGREGPVVHGSQISQEDATPIAPEDTTTPDDFPQNAPVLVSYLVLEDDLSEIYVAKCDVVAAVIDVVD